MLDYDFAQLNDKEFEALGIDLLSKFLGRRIERCKPGKVGGIGGRYFSLDGRELIVQFKHWKQAGIDALIRHLQDTERPKLKYLRPSRYLLATTLSLSHQDKADIKKAVAPWVKVQSDIFGREDLNTILLEFREIEERHHKLWFTSETNMAQLFNASIKGRGDFKLAAARSFASKYMETKAHLDAVAKLEELGTVIITGEPGIGKSTLAEQIALRCALRGFELCSVAESIDEVESVWDKEGLQLFYFDDFLGRNYFTALSRRDDSRVVGLIKRVARDKRKRFILTSRTTVLNQGKSLCGLLESENINRNEYELRVDGLSLLDKARILYSHLWNSNMSSVYVSELYEGARYLSICQHPNYNPRLIAFIMDAQKLTGIPAAKYWDYISDILKDPKEVWAHVFDQQLGRAARTLVKLTVFNGGDAPEDLLRAAFDRRHGGSASAEPEEDYRLALKLAVGSVLNRTLHAEKATITLFNPSLGDFIVNRFQTHPLEIMECLKALQTEASLSNLLALKENAIIKDSHFRQIIDGLAGEFLDVEDLSIGYRIHLAAHHTTTASKDSIQGLLRPFTIRLNKEDRLFLCVAPQARVLCHGVRENYIGNDSVQTTQKAFSLLQECSAEEDFRAVSELLSVLPAERRKKSDPVFIETYVDWLTENFDTWINEEGVLDEYDHPFQLGEATEKLRRTVASNLTRMAIAVPQDRIEKILGACDVEAILRERRERFWGPEYDAPDGELGDGNANAIEAVHDLFERT